jgi:16S rRNA (cytosine967-C5)-methyltransferase
MNVRARAISILARVLETDAYLNVVLDAALLEYTGDDERDAGLLTELCYGTVRRQLTLDYALSQVVDQPLSDLQPRVLSALRVGAYQIFYLRVPAHAAVSETVEACKQVGLARASGLANAVLRKLAQRSSPPLPPESDGLSHLSVRESHPVWMVSRWVRQFGRQRAEVMLAADNEAPPLSVRVNAARISREQLLSQLKEVGIEASALAASPAGVALPSLGRVNDIYGYSEGLWQVQDEAAQLVGVYASIPQGARVFDACAAPGGKACHLAETCTVVAADVHESKLRKIRAEAQRLGLSARLTAIQHDAATPLPEGQGPFDAVLVDAPCSGLGTLRRHPELRYRRKEEDIARLAQLSRRILENCQAHVAPGGLLVYAVCTLESEETIDVMDMFLRSHPEFTVEPPDAASLPLWQGYLRTLPGEGGMDGFFAARLRRSE